MFYLPAGQIFLQEDEGDLRCAWQWIGYHCADIKQGRLQGATLDQSSFKIIKLGFQHRKIK